MWMPDGIHVMTPWFKKSGAWISKCIRSMFVIYSKILLLRWVGMKLLLLKPTICTPDSQIERIISAHTRVLYFLWLAILGRLATKDFLFRPPIALDSNCALCPLVSENSIYVLRDCGKAKDFWIALGIPVVIVLIKCHCLWLQDPNDPVWCFEDLPCASGSK